MTALAFVVRPSDGDYEMGHVVVHAANRGQAKRRGADELELDFTEVSCRREKRFDGLTGNDLLRAQLDAGWIFQCLNCERRLCEDEWYDSGDDDEPLPRVVVRKGDVYCSSACCIAWLRQQRQYKVNAWEVVLEAVEYWPGIEITSVSGLTIGENGNAAVGSVRFRFPGGKYEGGWTRGDDAVHIANFDCEAWERFKGELAPRKGAGR